VFVFLIDGRSTRVPFWYCFTFSLSQIKTRASRELGGAFVCCGPQMAQSLRVSVAVATSTESPPRGGKSLLCALAFCRRRPRPLETSLDMKIFGAHYIAPALMQNAHWTIAPVHSRSPQQSQSGLPSPFDVQMRAIDAALPTEKSTPLMENPDAGSPIELTSSGQLSILDRRRGRWRGSLR
jgi:hypothetical protein